MHAAAQVVKLPAGKYTVREREMLSGVAGAPESYFMPGNAFSNSIIVGAAPVIATHACDSTVLQRHHHMHILPSHLPKHWILWALSCPCFMLCAHMVR